MRKAQTSMEFVILTGFMLIAFLIFYTVIQSKLLDANRNAVDTSAKQVETLVVNELKVAESVSDGYYREFELPRKINGLNYTIQILSGPGSVPEIVIKYEGKERVYFMPQMYVNDSSNISKGRNYISKNNGVILIRSKS